MADNAYEELFNCDVIDVNGDRVGSVGQVYLDDQTGQPSWVTVKTGLFGLKETFVPLEQAIVANGKITTPYESEKIKEAPRVDPDKHLDADEEAELYDYYGIATVVAVEPEEVAAATGLDEDADAVAEDAAVVAEAEVTEDVVVTEESEDHGDSGEADLDGDDPDGADPDADVVDDDPDEEAGESTVAIHSDDLYDAR